MCMWTGGETQDLDTSVCVCVCVHRDVVKVANLPRNQKSPLKAVFEAHSNSAGAVLVYTVHACGFICAGFW